MLQFLLMAQNLTTFFVEPYTPPAVQPMAIRFPESICFSEEDFFEFCQLNKDLRIERTQYGEILVMPPTGGETGSRGSEINMQLRLWAKQDGTGEVFDSSTGFTLPNMAMRSPDAAWVLRSRLAILTSEEKQKFIPLCPDFVIELKSPSDNLKTIQAKMVEYIENGTRLGWLLNPETRRVEIYGPGGRREVIEGAENISGDPVLPGFKLDLSDIWRPNM
jgi:Uma2 family endonuclease